MKLNKIVSLILMITLLTTTLMPLSIFAEETGEQTPRKVYLHARGKNPGKTYDFSEVSVDETTYVYFAIDDPNNIDNYDNSPITDKHIADAIAKAVSDAEDNLKIKAQTEADAISFESEEKKNEYIEKYISERIDNVRAMAAYRGEQMVRHTKPWDDLNGYMVKIYFDNTFFEFADTETTNAGSRIDYTIPDQNVTATDLDGEVNGIDVPETIGYYPELEGSGVVSGKLSCAYARVFFSGTFLPMEKNPENWYNLCALPLKPLKTGTTEVYIDINTSDEHTLELFAKHDKNYSPTFKAQAQNGGKHTIIIKDTTRPPAPWAEPDPGGYTKGDKISLKCEDSEIYDIYYSVNGGAEKLYTEPFEIDRTSVVECYCVKKTDTGKEKPSATVSYKYEIRPDKPLLFIGKDAKELIANVHNEKESFTVYADDAKSYDGKLDAGTYIYYTFTDEEASEYASPNSSWQRLMPNAGNSLIIDATEKVRLITVSESSNGTSVSDVSVYHLGIMPGDVSATPLAGDFTEPTKVELECKDDPDATIYYTLDGSDPRVNGIKYTDDMIEVSKDTTIRAVALKDGVYGEVDTFSYTYSGIDSPISAYLPSGEYEGGCNVALLCPDDKAIYYSTDGGKTWTPYTGAISVRGDTTILAKKENSDDVYEFVYDIKPTKPVFVPESTHFPSTNIVTVYSPDSVGDTAKDDEYTLYYTFNGDDPRDISKAVVADNILDTAIITVDGYTVIKAVVCKDGDFSDVAEHTYNVNPSRPAEPVPELAPGVYTQKDGEGPLFTGFLEEEDGNIEIYYTVSYDGKYFDDPRPVESNRYDDTPIEIKGRTIIKAIAVDVSNNTKSEVGVFEYVVVPEDIDEPADAPYCDKPSGTYEEFSDGKNRIFNVTLKSADSNDTIEYRVNGGGWMTCKSGSEITLVDDSSEEGRKTADVLLELRTDSGEIVSYVYEFVPPAPVISLKSGRYIKEPASYTTIGYSPLMTDTEDYEIYFRDGKTDMFAPYRTDTKPKYYIHESTSYEAYVISTKTGKTSEVAISYYVVSPDSAQKDVIYTTGYYEVKNGGTLEIDSYWLDKDGYRDGIKLLTKTGSTIMYKYTYNKVSGGSGGSEFAVYDPYSPIIVNSSMEDITVEAYLVDKDKNEIAGTRCVFNYEFIDLGIPEPSLEKKGENIFKSGTEYEIESEYDDDNIVIYYTLDKTDPTTSKTAKIYTTEDEKLRLTEDTATIKTVYYKACKNCADAEKCTHGIWGGVGTFKYSVEKKGGSSSSSSGGSGGGGSSSVVDKTRKYTKDIFGNEHPTHIGYINGYPDGSVRPEGQITREEVAAILYRVKNKEYDSPFMLTGEVFPDVKKDRWSALEIEYMTADAVIKGYPDGEFKPGRNLTRAEFAALIKRFAKLQISDSDVKFPDLPQEHWACEDIQALSGAGLMQGYEDGTFRPENNITRAEVMTVINKLLGRNPSESYVKSLGFNPFNDLLNNKWYYVTVLEATITHNYYLDSKNVEIKWDDYK